MLHAAGETPRLILLYNKESGGSYDVVVVVVAVLIVLIAVLVLIL